MAAERQLVLDANILIRAVLGRRVRQIITSHAEHASFYAPVVAYDDAVAYLPGLLAKGHIDGDAVSAAREFLEALPRIVRPVVEEIYESRRAEALSRIEARDPDDWPILAAALALDCPVWTEDQDFFGAGVPTWTTDRVELYLGDKPPDSYVGP